jgi:hypothetical protein
MVYQRLPPTGSVPQHLCQQPPLPREGDDSYRRGRHELRDEVKAEINHMDPENPGLANWFFCSGTLTWLRRSWTDGENEYVLLRMQPNRRTKCKEFMGKHQKEFKKVKYASEVNW